MGTITAICTSTKKGTQKQRVETATFQEDFGIVGDAHAGPWHRQVSLISADKIAAFKCRGAEITDGAFGENIIVQGIDFKTLPIGTQFQVGEVLLEMTQIGKECHSHCEIFKKMGECIMPIEGVFARVLQGGTAKIGDEMTILDTVHQTYKVAVVTLSDKGAKGQRVDESGPLIRTLVEQSDYLVVDQRMISDDQSGIEATLKHLTDKVGVDLIFTTGGTGFSPRDMAPEATLAVADRNASGIAEAIRANSMTITPRAMLSRGASVIRKNTLIINLPGSPKAVKECVEFILPSLKHGLDILTAKASECGTSIK